MKSYIIFNLVRSNYRSLYLAKKSEKINVKYEIKALYNLLYLVFIEKSLLKILTNVSSNQINLKKSSKCH